MNNLDVRAWDRRFKKMFYLNNRYILQIDSTWWMLKNTNPNWIDICYDNSYLMLYTWYDDINWERIYDCDIVTNTDWEMWIIKYWHYETSYWPDCDSYYDVEVLWFYVDFGTRTQQINYWNYKKIWNIYENINLLNKINNLNNG